MLIAYHGELYKVEEFFHKPDGVWLKLKGLNFTVKAEYVTIMF